MTNLHFEIVESMRAEHKATVDKLNAAIRDMAERAVEMHAALVRKNMALRVLCEESRSYIEWSKQMPFEHAIEAALAETEVMPELPNGI